MVESLMWVESGGGTHGGKVSFLEKRESVRSLFEKGTGAGTERCRLGGNTYQEGFGTGVS